MELEWCVMRVQRREAWATECVDREGQKRKPYEREEPTIGS